MIRINEDEKKSIGDLVKTDEWKVFEKILKGYLDELDKVTNLGNINKISVEAEVAGRVWVIKQLNSFLRSIGILSERPKTVSKTGE